MEYGPAAALIIVVVLLLVWFYRASDREHADIVAPSFSDAIVDKYRSEIKNKSGMTLNDYALEAKMVSGVPLSGDYRIL
jgi:hypothetical protein